MAPINTLSGLRKRYENDPARAAATAAADAEIDRTIARNDARNARMANMGRNPALEMNARRAAAGTYGPNTRGITLSGPGNGSSNSLREAAAYAAASPGLRRGSDVFGRNDREAHMAANRERIASGIGSITRYRQIQNKERAQRMANDQEYRMEGLRRRGDIEKERVAQAGQKEIEGLRQRGANYRARGESNNTLKLGMAQLKAQQESNAEMVKAIGQRPKTQAQLDEEQFNAEKAHFGNAKFDHGRGEYYWEGEDGQQNYFGAQANKHLMDDWVNRVAPSRMQYRDGRFYVPGENGEPDRYLPKAASDSWVNFYANNGDPNETAQDDEGNWFARGVPLAPEWADRLNAEREPTLQRYADAYQAAIAKYGPNVENMTPYANENGRFVVLPASQEAPEGFGRIARHDMRRVHDIISERRRSAAQAGLRR